MYYTIIGGVNGVGKSSYTGSAKERTTDFGIIIDVDKLTAEAGGNALIGGKQAIKKIEECLANNYSFTQETTLSGYKTEDTARRAKEKGYTVRLFYIALDSVEDSLTRIENRVRRGGHNIAANDVKRRFDTRWEAVAKVLPYCDVAEFYDNTNGFVKVAEYRNGELRPVGYFIPTWLNELQHFLANI